MSYDDTKLIQAVKAWLKQNVNVGYGEVYSFALQRDFEQFLLETHMLKSTPGQVAFGRILGQLGFQKKRVAGLTYWTGLELKSPPEDIAPRRHPATIKRMNKEFELRQRREERYRDEHIPNKDSRKERRKRVLAEAKKESAKKVRSAGERE